VVLSQHDADGFGCGDLQVRMAGLLSRSKNKGENKNEKNQPVAIGSRQQAQLPLRACRVKRVRLNFRGLQDRKNLVVSGYHHQ
jgi:hypothetical protein